MSRLLRRVHAFGTADRPPLCGQRDRYGKEYLPERKTTDDASAVTCRACRKILREGAALPAKPQGDPE